MAHSIQIVGEHVEIFKDLDLLSLVVLLNRLAVEDDFHMSKARGIIKQWHAKCEVHGPGTLDLELDVIVNDPDSRSEIDRSLSLLEERVKGFGGFVPAEYLNANRLRGIKFIDYDTNFVFSTIKRVRSLIAVD